ncbi:MAG TPA: SH3 domain-containing protein [Chloroflexia bacterium]|nr:SH3 domain-containing protein [Chloroflexia bacterium]
MPIRTNEPRLPLEPEEYPLYKPPRRFGCSGLTIVTLLTLGVFALLVWKVTPDMAKAITDLPKPLFRGQSTPETTRGAGALSTQTAIAAPTRPPVVTPTPIIIYVQLGNNSGQSIRMRSKPDSTSSYQVTLKGGEILQVISQDETDKNGNTWRHVQLLGKDGRNGWILSKYLNPYTGPVPVP